MSASSCRRTDTTPNNRVRLQKERRRPDAHASAAFALIQVVFSKYNHPYVYRRCSSISTVAQFFWQHFRISANFCQRLMILPPAARSSSSMLSMREARQIRMISAAKKYSFQEPTAKSFKPCFECGVKIGTLPQMPSSAMWSRAPINANISASSASITGGIKLASSS